MRANLPRILVAVIVLAVALAVPFFTTPSNLTVATVMLISALFALSFALLAGQAGLLSFGHAAFFGAGVFTTIHLLKLGESGAFLFPTPFIPIAGGLVALVVAAIIGYFATRRSGIYFSMITFAIAELVYVLSPSMPGIFGGESGMSSMRMPWAGISFANDTQVYYLVLAWTAVCTILLFAFTRTLFGRLTVALRENEQRITFLGYDQHKTKVLVFAISGFFSGIAGSLLAMMTENAVSTVFMVHTSAAVVLQTFIGGATTFLGPAVGAMVLTLLQSAVNDETRLWFLYQGILFIAVMLLLPQGLFKAFLDQIDTIRREGASALPPLLRVAAGAVLVALSVIFVCEFIAVFFSTSYSGLAAASGSYAPIRIFGRDWTPASLVTVLFPLATMALGVAVLRGRFAGARVPWRKAPAAQKDNRA